MNTKTKLLICLVLFIGMIVFQSCQKESNKYYERHEELIWNDNTNQFNFVLMHETAPEKVEEPNLEWQYYGGYYPGSGTMKYRYKHIMK